jgi:hypothetical protein
MVLTILDTLAAMRFCCVSSEQDIGSPVHRRSVSQPRRTARTPGPKLDAERVVALTISLAHRSADDTGATLGKPTSTARAASSATLSIAHPMH